LLSANDVAWMAAAQESAMPDELRLLTRTSSATAEGHIQSTDSWSAAHPCHLIMHREGDEVADIEPVPIARARYQLTYPKALTITPADQVKVNGLVYEVDSVEDPQEWQTAGRAVIRRLS
jgi:hypothetical protein